ncbi:threonylcarbamoyl-AMP synthase [Lysobacter ciconiae]|uniref:Threonylcarbamoyl-AMP synthase n=1 Tax=Novilysobacter ciconiae TaxID=2781022 RepID=A0A7S6UGC1_9GAMM|nr:L-threonylcarbamoyladenylate synthase [Lysobacter ciconiae]QOW19704.1 threonylcarbamoyl-AMP synthase [Lysobacter ciconiae]
MPVPSSAATCDLPSAVRVLRGGGVIAYPTEAVWGLGCDPFDQTAVRRLLEVKQRPVEKGLILIAGALAQLDGLVDWSGLAAERCVEVRASWPGPHTWVVPATAAVPRVITGDHDSVAVRVSAHPTVVALCAAWGGVLVSTSANLAGQPAVTAIDQLDPELLARIDAVLAGEPGGRATPSTIRDARTGAVLRA